MAGRCPRPIRPGGGAGRFLRPLPRSGRFVRPRPMAGAPTRPMAGVRVSEIAKRRPRIKPRGLFHARRYSVFQTEGDPSIRLLPASGMMRMQGMKMKRTIALAAFALLLGAVDPAECQAISFSGNRVLESCRSVAMSKDPISAGEGLFMGDCAGMTRTLVAIGSHLPPKMRFCVPGAVTFQQASKVFVAFLDAHPERLQELSTVLAIDAFRAAWPCSATAAKVSN